MPEVQVVIPDPQGPVQLIIPDEPRIVKIVVSGISFGGVIPADVARLSLPNVFQRENTFPAIRITPRVVTENYAIKHTDGEIVVDASAATADTILVLPISGGNGHGVRVTRRDNTSNNVIVGTQGSDLFADGSNFIYIAGFQTATFVAADDNFWEQGVFIPPFILPSNLAILDQNNIFTGINTFSGFQLPVKTISASYVIDRHDYAIYVQGITEDIDIQLPAATAFNNRGQPLVIVFLDDSSFLVRINAQPGENINGASSVTLVEQYAQAELLEAGFGFWSNISPISGGDGGADFGTHGRVVDLFPIQGFSFEVWDEVGDGLWHEQVRYTEPGGGPTPVASQQWVWRNDINNKTDLAALVTADTYAVGSRVDADFQADPDMGTGLKTWVLRSGAADGSDPGQVAPGDYNAGTNNVHWESVG